MLCSSDNLTIAISGTSGSGLDQLDNPQDLTLDESSGVLYIADTDNHRIMSYASNASNGTVAAGGNGAGSLSTQLNSPYAVCFDSSSNSLVIANYDSHTIVQWVIGSSSWTVVAGFIGTSGNTAVMLQDPTDVILDSSRNIYVADYGNERVQLFLSSQSNGKTIAGVTDTPGKLDNLLNGPFSIAFDSNMNLYVADYSNHRIQKFDRY